MANKSRCFTDTGEHIARQDAEIARLREALKPFAHYYDLNDCQERPADDALEVPIRDLLAAKRACEQSLKPTQES
jgi:hypothetical protein